MTARFSRRARRIASDDAHSWARNLRLGNPYAKLVLCMLTLYVNGDGTCYVSATALAEDCELAVETVRRRLAWLESIGTIARVAQWVDDSGRRNGEGRGRRSTDEIKLLTDADIEEIEARAHNKNATPHAPLQQEGAKDDGESISPLATPSLQPRAKDSEPEPEESPQPPKGEKRAETSKEEIELDKWVERFAAVYPIPITDLPRTKAAARVLTPQEREDAITGARAYGAFLEQERRCRGRTRNVKDAHRWLRDKQWIGYLPKARADEKVATLPRTFHRGTSEYLALENLAQIARYSPLKSSDGAICFRGEITPKILAFANAPPCSEWVYYERGSQNFGSWWRLIVREVFPGCALPDLRAIRAPWPFPPRVDGSIGPPAQSTDPPRPVMTEEDEEFIRENQGL